MKVLNKFIATLSFMVAVIFCIAIFPSSNHETSKISHALSYGIKNLQSSVSTLTDDVTYKMYDETGTVSSLSYWSYYNDRGAVPTNDYSSSVSATEVRHYADSSSNTSKADGYFYMIADIAENIVNAGKNGFASLDVQVYVKSAVNSSKDAYDYVYGYLYEGSSTGSNDYESFEIAETINDSQGVSGTTPSDYSLMKFRIDSITTESVMLKANSGYVKSGSLGISYNAIYLKEPQFIISSSDVTRPSISWSINENWSNESKTLALNISDSESGVQSVYVNDELIVPEFSSDTKTATYDYSIEQNGSYEIKVIDNVGNVSTKTYTESKIDKNAPSATVSEVEENYAEKSITFSATFVKPGAGESEDAFTYVLTLNSIYGKELTENVVETGVVTEGLNSISVAENGTYTLEVCGVDEASNTMATIAFNMIIVDARPRVSLEIETDYTFSPAGLLLVYEKSIDDEYAISFEFFSEDGTSKYNSLSNVGTYLVSYTIDDYNYYGEGEETIVISPKAITISDVQTEYTYNELAQELQYQASEEITLNVEFAQNAELAEFVNVGEYNYTISSTNSNYVVSNGTGVAQIKKCLITLSNIKSTFVYNAEEQFVEFDVNVEKLKNQIICYYYFNEQETSSPVQAGNYNVVFGFVGDSINYEFVSYVSFENALSMTILKREVVVSVNSQTITYGDDIEELSYSVSNALSAEPLTFTLSAENLSVNAGYYNIIINQKYAQSEEELEIFRNYCITYSEGYVEILKKNAIVVPTQRQSKIYGNDDCELTYSVQGLVNGDVLFGGLEREQGEDIGYYNITLGNLNNSNYSISIENVVFEIKKRTAFVILNESEKVYGNEDPSFTFIQDGSNVLQKDIASFELKDLFVRNAGENVGKYSVSINLSFAETHDVLKNYLILSSAGTLSIKKADVFVKANDITAVYGEPEKELTATVEGLVFGDEIVLTLSREVCSDVGVYAISLNPVSSSNYNINFEAGTYEILPREISIVAVTTSKTYGETDVFDYEVFGTSEMLDVVLIREQGEDAGQYEIYDYELDNENYLVTNFEKATFTIEKVKLSVEILSLKKEYGSADPEFKCVVAGLKNNETVSVELERVSGEKVGVYEISVSNKNTYDNYVIDSIVSANLEITKANVSITLSDKHVVYSGEIVEIDAPEFAYALSYKYMWMGTEIEKPVNAGEYEVVAYFAGNDCYNSAYSNTAKIVIDKKLIPIALKTLTFLYNGKQQAPEYEINFEKNVSILINYKNDIVPIEVGEYEFTFVSNDSNYYTETSGVLKIVGDFYNQNNNGSSVSSSNVSYSGSDVKLVLTNNSTLMHKFNPLFDGIKCVAVYEFANAEAYKSSGEIFTVKLKAVDGDANVEIYTIDEKGNYVKTLYTEVDGYYVFSVNTLSGKFMVMKTNNWMQYAKIIATALVLILSIAVTKGVNKRRNKKYFTRNTKFTKLDLAELESVDIVKQKLVKEKNKLSISEYLQEKE